MKAAVTLLLHLVALSCMSRSVVEGQNSGEEVAGPEAKTTKELWALMLGLLARVHGGSQFDFITLKHENSETQDDMFLLKNQMQMKMSSELMDETLALRQLNSDVKNEILDLKRELQRDKTATKISFTAGLGSGQGGLGYRGPYNNERTLIFQKVVTNIGSKYDKSTGVFTASVKGLYYFIFTVADFRSFRTVGAKLYVNGVSVMWNGVSTDRADVYMTNALTLELSAADRVYMTLPAGYGVYDNNSAHCTFSGFLLFPL